MPKFVPLAQADQEDAAASGEGAPRFVPLAEADHLPDDAPAAQKPLPEDVTPSEGRGRGFTDPRLVGKLPTPQGAPSVSDMELTPVSSTDPNAAGGFTASRDTSGSVLDDQGGGDVSNLRASRRQNVLDDALGPHTLKPESQTRGQLMARNRSLEAGESFGDALSDPVSRGVVKAVTGGAQSMAGTVRAVADQAARFDVPGARQVGEFARGAGQGATDFETGMGEASGPKDTTFGPNSPVPYLARMGEGAVSSLAQSAQLATVMGPRAVIPMMALQQAGQQYQQAREQGLSPDLALANAIPSGAFEAIGEKFSGLDKAAGAMRTLLARGATQQAKIDAGHTLVEFGFKELPGELITTVGQDAIDKMPGIGLKQNMTMEDFINDLRDTAVQTAMMSGVTIGAGHGVASHAAGQPQMSAEALARSKGFLALDEQAKRMKAAGETELAATIQKQADTGRAADELETLKDRPWADDPTFGERYTALRADGKKPAEAAARAGMAAAYEHLANGLGVAEEVWKKGVDAAAKLPMEKVPAFFEAFTAALVKKGASQPAPEGTVHGTVQGVRDDAIATTIHGVYGEDTPAETMDAITKLERREAADSASPAAVNTGSPSDSAVSDAQDAGDQPLKLLTPNEAGAHLAATSPLGDGAEPTNAQKDAGNYRVGRMRINGMDVSIENPEGSTRSGTDASGKKWETTMTAHYGYLRSGRAANPSENGGVAAIEDLGNSREGQALPSQTFGKLDVNGQKVVVRDVLSALHDDKVFKSVVELVPVDVMHMLVGSKGSTEELLHDKAMFLDRLTSALDDPVVTAAVGRLLDRVAASHPVAFAALGAKEKAALGVIEAPGADRKISFAAGAVHRGSHKGNVTPLAADGDHVDVFVKPNTPEDFAGPVYVVDQVDPKSGQYDEAKVVIGAGSLAEAKSIYHSNYSQGWKGLGAIHELPMAQFKQWAFSDAATKPLSPDIRVAAPTKTDARAAPDSGEVRPNARAGATGVQTSEDARAVAAPLRLGITPNDADAVTVKDGVVHIGKSPAIHYETGEPVTVADGATDAAIRQALKDAGAVSRRQKFFGGAKEAPAAAPTPEPEKINTPAPAPRPVLPPDALARRKPARVALPQTSPKGEPVHAHGFIAAEGGLRKSEMADTGFDKNLRVGNRWLFAGDGKGLSIEQATEKLVEAGYLKPGAGHNEAYDLIRKSATHAPQYTPEGWEQLGEAGHKARFEEQLEAVSAKSDPLADIEDAPDELSKEDMQVQREFAALVATAEAQGIDTDSILEEAFYLTQNGPLHEYHAEVSRRLDAERARLAAGAGAGSGQAAQGAGDEPGRHAAEQPGQRAGDQVPGAASGQETASDAHTVGARVTRESALLDGSTIRDDKGTEYRVHYQRNALVIAHPIVNGKPQVSSTTSVRFWTDPSQPSASENDRTDPIYVVAQPTAKPVLPPDALAKPRDLLGEAPNASQQAAAAAKAALEEKARKQQQAAPDASTFTMAGSDRADDVGTAHGQADLLGGKGDDLLAHTKAHFDTFPAQFKVYRAVWVKPGEKPDLSKPGDYWAESEEGARRSGFPPSEGRTEQVVIEATAKREAIDLKQSVARRRQYSEPEVVLTEAPTGAKLVGEPTKKPVLPPDALAKKNGALPAQVGNGAASGPFHEALDAGRRGPAALRDALDGRAFLGHLRDLAQVPRHAGEGGQAAQPIDGLAPAGQRRLDDVHGDAKALGNVLERVARDDAALSGLNAEAQGAMLSHVLRLAGDDQVRQIVVQLVPVVMVHDLVGKQLTTDGLLNDPAVLKQTLTTGLASPVAALRDFSDALVRAVALAGAEVGAGHVLADLKGPAVKGGAAVRAGDSNLGHGSDATRQGGVADTIQTKETDKGTAMFARGPVWKSELETAIAGAAMKQAPAAGWSEFIAGLGKKGVKPDEIEWSGIKDWLAMQPGKVSREAVLEYLKGNGVQVQEVHKGGTNAIEALDRMVVEADALGYTFDRDTFNNGDEYAGRDIVFLRRSDQAIFEWKANANEWVELNKDGSGRPLGADDELSEQPPEELTVMANELAIAANDEMTGHGDADGTRYSQYTLPGGQNYREVLLTLPVTQGEPATFAVHDAHGKQLNVFQTHEKAQDFIDRNAAFRSGMTIKPLGNKNEQTAYRSSHWSEPNILAHIRLNDRYEAPEPYRTRERSNNLQRSQLASMLPLEIVESGVAGLVDHDEVRRDVIAALPVDVVDMLRALKLSPEQLLSDKPVLANLARAPLAVRLKILSGLSAALGKAHARIATEVRASLVAGLDREILPALRTSDLDPAEVRRLIGPDQADASAQEPEPASAGARAAFRRTAGGVGELSVADRARLADVHARMVNDRTDNAKRGKRVLFVEELQSDFGQDYRKSRDAIGKAVDGDFLGIVERMKKDGVLKVECD